MTSISELYAKNAYSPQEPFPVPVMAPKGYHPAPPNAVIETDSPLHRWATSLENRIYGNWERQPKFESLIVSFTVTKDGSFENVHLRNPTQIAQDNFDAMEAVAESSRFQKKFLEYGNEPTDIDITLTASRKLDQFDCAKSVSQPERSSLNIGDVIWHLIPLDALQSNPELDPYLVHNPTNLRIVRSEYAQSSEMDELRKQWTTFLRGEERLSPTNLTRQARYLESRYGFMFKRLVRRRPASHGGAG